MHFLQDDIRLMPCERVSTRQCTCTWRLWNCQTTA